MFINIQISAEGNGVCFGEGVRQRGRAEVTAISGDHKHSCVCLCALVT